MKYLRNKKTVFFSVFLIVSLMLMTFIPSFAVASKGGEPTNSFYVSDNGTDAGDGSEENPFATIAAARDAIRKNRSTLTGGVVVYVKDGIYKQSQTLVFNEQDSGSDDFPIIYKAFGDGDVVIDGGITLDTSGFTKPSSDDEYVTRVKDSTAREKIIKYDLEAAGIDYKSSDFAIFYGGERGTLARYPNEQFILGFHDLSEGHRDLEQYMCNESAGIFYDKENVVGTWADIDGVRICGNFQIDWATSTPLNLVDYDRETNRVKVSSGGMSGYSGRYYYSNAVEEIDMVGEYYISTEGILYFYPPDGYENIRIGVPYVGDLIQVEKADHITFDGFVIENAKSVLVSVDANDFTVKNSIVRCGNNGINTNGYRNTIYNNDVYHIGGTAISVLGGDMARIIPSDTLVDNNKIHEFGDVHRVYSGGLYAEGVGFTISHNEIYNCPHTSFQNLAMNMIVEYNYFHDLCYEGGDAGAIYDGTWRGNGNIFRYNVITDITNPSSPYYTPNGYYCDDGGGGKTFVSNIIANVDGCAIHMGGGPANIITDNIIMESGIGIRYDQRAYYPWSGPNAGWTLTGYVNTDFKGGVLGSTNTGLNWGWMTSGMTGYAGRNWYMNFPWTMLLKTTNVVDLEDNFVSCAFLTARVRGNVIDTISKDEMQNNFLRLAVVRDNVREFSAKDIFVDFENKDYTIREDSKIWHELPGFKPCDFAQVGVQPAE